MSNGAHTALFPVTLHKGNEKGAFKALFLYYFDITADLTFNLINKSGYYIDALSKRDRAGL